MFAVHVHRSSYVSPGSLHPSCIRTTKCDELHPSGLLTVSPGITLRLLWHQATPMGALRRMASTCGAEATSKSIGFYYWHRGTEMQPSLKDCGHAIPPHFYTKTVRYCKITAPLLLGFLAFQWRFEDGKSLAVQLRCWWRWGWCWPLWDRAMDLLCEDSGLPGRLIIGKQQRGLGLWRQMEAMLINIMLAPLRIPGPSGGVFHLSFPFISQI